jgi:hypothetical protein
MFESKKIGTTELSLIKQEKESLLNRLAYNKKALLYGVLICWTICFITLIIFWFLEKNIDISLLIFGVSCLPLIQLWVFFEEFTDIKKRLKGLDYLINKDQIDVLNIQSDRFYQLEELHDLGEYYLFEINPKKLILLGGQEFYPTESFPNAHFEIIEGRDKEGKLLIFEILEKGERIEPIKKLKGKECELIFNISASFHDRGYSTFEADLIWIDRYLKNHLT